MSKVVMQSSARESRSSARVDYENSLVVLVDYANVSTADRREKRHDFQRSRVRTDLEFIAAGTANLIAEQHAALRRPIDVRLRLYGGWIAEDGFFTGTAERVLSESARKRFFYPNKYRMRFEVALTCLCSNRHQLAGTVRLLVRRPRQKMVDSMIISDLVVLSERQQPVAVLTDDTDIVPGLLHGAAFGNVVYWWRPSQRRLPINSVSLATAGIHICNFEVQNDE